MGYEKSFWVPNEKDIGQYWKSFFNKYLKEDVTPELIELILKDHDTDWDDSLIHELANLRLSFELLILKAGNFHNSLFVYANNQPPEFYHKNGKTETLRALNELLINYNIEAYSDIEWWAIIPHMNQREVNRVLSQTKLKEEFEQAKLEFGAKISSSQFLDLVIRKFKFIYDLSLIKSVTLKTWGRTDVLENWTLNEYTVINDYFQECDYCLYYSEIDSNTIDPHNLEFTRYGAGPIAGIYGIAATLHWLIIDYVWDFVDELLVFNKYQSIKGSAQCKECGQFYAKSFYGHGQKYCSSQCKARAAKRRHREKQRKDKFLKRHSK